MIGIAIHTNLVFIYTYCLQIFLLVRKALDASEFPEFPDLSRAVRDRTMPRPAKPTATVTKPTEGVFC